MLSFSLYFLIKYNNNLTCLINQKKYLNKNCILSFLTYIFLIKYNNLYFLIKYNNKLHVLKIVLIFKYKYT